MPAIQYASKVITTVGTRLRLVPLAINNRNPPLYTITAAASALAGAESISVTAAASTKLWPGTALVFDKGGAGESTAYVASEVTVTSTATPVPVVPLALPIASAATASTLGSVYVAGVTDSSPTSSPKTVDTTNYLSGTGMEMAIVGTNRTLSMSFNQVEGDPGGKLLKDILYIDNFSDREIFAIYERPNGETYKGACIPTSGDQTGAVQDLAKMTVALQFQGASFTFNHAKNAPVIPWPTT